MSKENPGARTDIRYFNGRRYHVLTSRKMLRFLTGDRELMFTRCIFINHTQMVSKQARFIRIPE